MYSLEEIRINNSIIAWCGLYFTEPLFRKLAGQVPYEVKTFTIYESDDKKKNKKFRSILSKNDDPFILVFRGENAELEEVVFVPSKHETMEMVENNERAQ